MGYLWAQEDGSIVEAEYLPSTDTVSTSNVIQELQNIFSQFSHNISCTSLDDYSDVYKIQFQNHSIPDIIIGSKGTTPGGRTSLKDEMRIQINSSSINYLFQMSLKGIYCLLLGIYKRNNQSILCAWKVNNSEAEPNNTVSKQIKIKTIAEAMKYGFSQQKRGDEFVCAFRKEFIFFYLQNNKWLHNTQAETYNGINKLASSEEEENLQAQNFTLDNLGDKKDLITSFISAIRTKPFLLLAGISGTGKSRLARQLAQATATDNLADDQKPGNYELIPVKPNWHDSTELLGYVSRISGTPEYVMTDFVRFLFKAMIYPETPFFLCLDEMNLAPVEQYFAEYLSVIETRSKLSDGTIVTDVLVKFDSEIKKSFMQQLGSYYDSLNHDGDFTIIWQQIEKDGGLRIPPNLVVIGTVNMDETTFSFSRKVLDRAMSFELNVVDMNDGVKNDNAILQKIPSEAVTPKLLTANDAYTACPPVAEYVLKRLTKINEEMKDKPFKIAYRSRNEIMVYVYERMKDAIAMDFPDDNSIKTSALFHQAMDEAISMKILSRIEGDEQRISIEFLNKLKDAISGEVQISQHDIDDDVDNQTAGSLSKMPEDDGDNVKPYPICTEKLEQMKKQLANGYVSFWS
ncbi:MAG: AAA family ATPase [Lentisphaeria bacterium]|nr:AAA family ATPase [Lentisphaeria bacterium]